MKLAVCLFGNVGISKDARKDPKNSLRNQRLPIQTPRYVLKHKKIFS